MTATNQLPIGAEARVPSSSPLSWALSGPDRVAQLLGQLKCYPIRSRPGLGSHPQRRGPSRRRAQRSAHGGAARVPRPHGAAADRRGRGRAAAAAPRPGAHARPQPPDRHQGRPREPRARARRVRRRRQCARRAAGPDLAAAEAGLGGAARRRGGAWRRRRRAAAAGGEAGPRHRA
ncbi:MAG: hypothetical protein J3K34DRAFT_403632 [Monoraphidium minutum]|nr:MAG: hypothetical protein J3K34DRAFT_403632 [Monoraphidium minutum]